MATPAINPFDLHHRPKVVAKFDAEMFSVYTFGRAIERGNDREVLINTWGGLGDQVCAIPAIRYALQAFKGYNFYLASRCPSLFAHLPFKGVIDTRKEEPEWDEFNVVHAMVSPDHAAWGFMSHMLMHPVDHASILMFRMQLPIGHRSITLPDFNTKSQHVAYVKDLGHDAVVVHAGRTWPSKTLPYQWWCDVVGEIRDVGLVPVLIGQNVDDKTGYVDIPRDECVDLRNKLSVPEFVELLKSCRMLLSNDSAPIHVAAAGDAFIGFVSTVKHPDFLMHWRRGEFGYKTASLGLDNAWHHSNYAPMQLDGLDCYEINQDLMQSILPNPKDVAELYRRRKSLYSRAS